MTLFCMEMYEKDIKCGCMLGRGLEESRRAISGGINRFYFRFVTHCQSTTSCNALLCSGYSVQALPPCSAITLLCTAVNVGRWTGAEYDRNSAGPVSWWLSSTPSFDCLAHSPGTRQFATYTYDSIRIGLLLPHTAVFSNWPWRGEK